MVSSAWRRDLARFLLEDANRSLETVKCLSRSA